MHNGKTRSRRHKIETHSGKIETHSWKTGTDNNRIKTLTLLGKKNDLMTSRTVGYRSGSLNESLSQTWSIVIPIETTKEPRLEIVADQSTLVLDSLTTRTA
jgi:hypothetical protein